VFGPGGVGDKMRVQLNAGGDMLGSAAPAQGHLERALRRGRHRVRHRRGTTAGPADPGRPARPRPARGRIPRRDRGTIVLGEDLSLVAATAQAWWWIDHLGPPGPNPDEPLPSVLYVVATQVANSPERPRRPARIRVRAADGSWMVIRVAPLATVSQVAAGYAVTLEAAPAVELAPLLMRAWGLTPREREVARLVIDGRSSEDIAAVLFISVRTVRDHVKVIFAKVGVSRRQDLVAVLTGRGAVS
jgi:DNA-binding CsgD family transcriptional regulator